METEQITIGKLTAQVRHTMGKGPARRTRAKGQIPCVVYGGGKDPVALLVDPLRLQKCLDPQKRRNTLIDLTIEGDTPVNEKVMLKDYQLDVLRQDLTHADFIRIDLSKTIKIKVPLVLEGKAEGLKLGGVLHQVFRHLEVECTADLIPAKLGADISALNIGESINIGDIPVPDGVSICLPVEQTCALVMAPRAADAAEEGEEGAEGEEGVATEEGAKADGGDKPAED